MDEWIVGSNVHRDVVGEVLLLYVHRNRRLIRHGTFTQLLSSDSTETTGRSISGKGRGGGWKGEVGDRVQVYKINSPQALCEPAWPSGKAF